MEAGRCVVRPHLPCASGREEGKDGFCCCVSCQPSLSSGANERVMPQGVFHLVIILLSFLFYIYNLYTVETGDKAQSLVWLCT